MTPEKTPEKSGLSVDITELSNAPINVVSVGDLRLDVRQLSIAQLFGVFGQKIRSKKLEEAEEMAALIDDPSEKQNFRISAWKNLPSGSELTVLSADLMESVPGIVDILSLSSGVDRDEIERHVTFNNVDVLAPTIKWILGGDLEEEAEEVVESEGEPEEEGEDLSKKKLK